MNYLSEVSYYYNPLCDAITHVMFPGLTRKQNKEKALRALHFIDILRRLELLK